MSKHASSPQPAPAADDQPQQALSPKFFLVIAVVLVLIGGGAVGVAHFAGKSTASSVAKAQGLVPAASAPHLPALDAADWIQTPPLTGASLLGKVVLVDFWDASCINCRRTFPFLRDLYATYKSRGFVVLGVHSPEFSFEHSADYVAREAKELGVTWPVANDPDMKIWSEFGNQYWPAQYLVDRAGKVRLAHAGEGDDSQLETDVRSLLDQGGTAGAAHVGDVKTTELPGTFGTKQTPESYLGAERGGNSLPQGTVATGKTVTRTDPAAPPLNGISLDGSFTGSDQFLTGNVGATVTLAYQGRDVYAILSPHGGSTSSPLKITLDGKPVPPALRGPSLTVDSAGKTVVDVTRQDLFHLVTGPTGTDPTGTITLSADSSAFDIYTFTFGA